MSSPRHGFEPLSDPCGRVRRRRVENCVNSVEGGPKGTFGFLRETASSMPKRGTEPSELAMPMVMNTNAYATLAGALDELTRRGFTEGFQVVDGGLRALGHPKTLKPKDLVIREIYRFEGIS